MIFTMKTSKDFFLTIVCIICNTVDLHFTEHLMHFSQKAEYFFPQLYISYKIIWLKFIIHTLTGSIYKINELIVLIAAV